MKLLALLVQLLLAGAEDDTCFLQWNASHSRGHLHQTMRGVVLEANELISKHTALHDGSMYTTLATISGWDHASMHSLTCC